MTNIRENHNRANGYFILAVISVGTTFLSVYLTNGINRKKNKDVVAPQQSNKAMMIAMPLIMGFFAIMYNSVFAFYLVVSQIVNVALSPLENMLVNKWEGHEVLKEEQKVEVEYSRKKVK